MAKKKGKGKGGQPTTAATEHQDSSKSNGVIPGNTKREEPVPFVGQSLLDILEQQLPTATTVTGSQSSPTSFPQAHTSNAPLTKAEKKKKRKKELKEKERVQEKEKQAAVAAVNDSKTTRTGHAANHEVIVSQVRKKSQWEKERSKNFEKAKGKRRVKSERHMLEQLQGGISLPEGLITTQSTAGATKPLPIHGGPPHSDGMGQDDEYDPSSPQDHLYPSTPAINMTFNTAQGSGGNLRNWPHVQPQFQNPLMPLNYQVPMQLPATSWFGQPQRQTHALPLPFLQGGGSHLAPWPVFHQNVSYNNMPGQRQYGQSGSPQPPMRRRERSVTPLPVPVPSPEYLAQVGDESVCLVRPQTLLIVMDLNGTLVYRSRSTSVGVLRDGVAPFVAYLLQNFQVMVWSSAQPDNVKRMCNQIFSPRQLKSLLGRWGRDTLGLSQQQYEGKVQVYKRLKQVWEASEKNQWHPEHAQGGRYGLRNTVLLDDSILKASSEPFNLIQVPEFDRGGEDANLQVLAQVAAYLDLLKWQDNVAAYMKQNPFLVDGKWKCCGPLAL